MPATAKSFSAAGSQSVQLPNAFRVDATEPWISADNVAGEITLKPKPKAALDSTEAFSTLLTSHAPSAEFLQPRNDAPADNCIEGLRQLPIA